MTNQTTNQIEPTFENLRTILLEEIIRPYAYGAQDEEKVCTIVNRTQAILDALYCTDEGLPTVDKKAARRILYQINGTYNDAVYTAQRRTGEILNALRGL